MLVFKKLKLGELEHVRCSRTKEMLVVWKKEMKNQASRLTDKYRA